MKILAIGDIVGVSTIHYLRETLWKKRSELGIDLVVANGENASDIHGLTAKNAREIFDCGVDVITLGNHTYSKRDIYPFLDSEPHIIRPANYPPSCPGSGYTTVNVCGWKILCINVMGNVGLDSLASPFTTVASVLERESGNYDFSLLDLHAEATSEKIALARYFDGRINIIFGTHTHVQTADEQTLPNGTAYITDLGMSGPVNGVIGASYDSVIKTFIDHMPSHFGVADGDIRICGAVFTIDTSNSGRTSVSRITF